MDILKETRKTQVQLPTEAVTGFFGNRDAIELTRVHRGQAMKTDQRPLINLENKTHRIELDAIRTLPRPQIVRFFHDGSDQYSYQIIQRGTSLYRTLDSVLDEHGRQTRAGSRRWLPLQPGEAHYQTAMAGLDK